jgi:mannose-1-phosphate guanylyltransferase
MLALGSATPSGAIAGAEILPSCSRAARDALLARESQANPKPFVPLVGARTLLADTLERLRLLAPAKNTTVIATESRAASRSTLRATGTHLLLEPLARNTAAAIAWAAADALGRGRDGVIGVFPADHHIARPDAFAKCVTRAARAAADGERLVLVGIEPTRPDTAYGYLRLGEDGGAGAVRPVERFVEKPRLARARRFVA